MSFLQLVLMNQWDFLDVSVVLSWTPAIESDLTWWSNAHNLLAGVSLVSPQSDLFWSDVSDQGWGSVFSPVLSPALNLEAQLLLRWTESQGITIVPQFTMGSLNVMVDS